METIINKRILLAICEHAKKWDAVKNSGKSDACIMVLELMGTDEYGNDYCHSLECVLSAFPEVDRAELEKELDKYV